MHCKILNRDEVKIVPKHQLILTLYLHIRNDVKIGT